jgi:hypothetical protein
MKRFMNKKVATIGLAAGLALGAAGAAFAYFTSTGQGTGSASTGTSTALVVASTADVSNSLTPGGPSETIAYTVTNNSSGNQELNQVTIQVAGSSGTSPSATPTTWTAQANGSLPACAAGDFSVGGATAGATFTDTTGQPVTLAPAGVYHGTVTIAMVNGTDAAPTNGATPGPGAGNQDNCESISPPLFFAAS